MVPLLVLAISALVFRGVGAVGVKPLASWRASARGALALMLVFTASAHFGPMKTDLRR